MDIKFGLSEVDIDFLCTDIIQIALGLQSLPPLCREIKKTQLRRTWTAAWSTMYKTTQI